MSWGISTFSTQNVILSKKLFYGKSQKCVDYFIKFILSPQKTPLCQPLKNWLRPFVAVIRNCAEVSVTWVSATSWRNGDFSPFFQEVVDSSGSHRFFSSFLHLCSILYKEYSFYKMLRSGDFLMKLWEEVAISWRNDDILKKRRLPEQTVKSRCFFRKLPILMSPKLQRNRHYSIFLGIVFPELQKSKIKFDQKEDGNVCLL